MAYQTTDLIGAIFAVFFGIGAIVKSKSITKDLIKTWGGSAAYELFCRIGFIVTGAGAIFVGIIFFYQYFYGKVSF